MKYSTRRDLREKLYRAYNTKCVTGGEFDNQENVKKIVNLRLEIANLLGYENYAEIYTEIPDGQKHRRRLRFTR